MKKLAAIILSIALILTFTACSSSNPYASSQVGGIIQFGGIDWLVLDVQGGKALIISDKVIKDRTDQYNDTLENATWGNSYIRKYLNGNFYYTAFNEEEKNLIIKTTVKNENNPDFGTPGGNETTDNIFLLSIDEASKYFADNTKLIALDYNNEAVWWWLRSPGMVNGTAAYVSAEGVVFPAGRMVKMFVGDVVSNGFGVRPALWLNIK